MLEFRKLGIPGSYLIELDPIIDQRGFFARTFCATEFSKLNLCSVFKQHSISFNKSLGTLRGVHYQSAPHSEIKLVSCNRGRIYDVLLDLRKDSPTYKVWVALVLDSECKNMVYIPEGVAHGFQTLADNTEVNYLISTPFVPESYRGVRWNDPAFSIDWPLSVSSISDKDANHPFYE